VPTPSALPLAVRDLTFRYRQRTDVALRHVSFTAAPGEILLIAGASGSGKTTLLRCLNGLIPHSYKGGELAGEIHIFGQAPASLSLAQISKMVGTVLQDPEKQVVGSYVDNEVAFGLENLGVPRPEMRRRIGEVLEHLGIAHLQGRETFQLSGGEKQKVVVAGILVLEPSILLLDEPLANLDPTSLQEPAGRRGQDGPEYRAPGRRRAEDPAGQGALPGRRRATLFRRCGRFFAGCRPARSEAYRAADCPAAARKRPGPGLERNDPGRARSGNASGSI
jgi:energy-coupling factor transporter ATP-binding protein EcfA2